MSQEETFTIGVEEEYQIIDPTTRELSASALSILRRASRKLGKQVQPELKLSQIEVATPVCHTLADVRTHLQQLRREVINAAQQEGKVIASAGTHPLSHWKEQPVTPKKRYRGLARDYQQLAYEQAIFGCHIHIGLRDREVAVQVMNRMRIWLPALLALTASSPFWLGEDTGYESFRTEMWGRWPMSGPPVFFASLQELKELAEALIAIGAIEDTTKIYWDMRLSERFETVEIRVSDACTSVNEAVMLAGLTRALVRTCYQQEIEKVPFKAVRPEILRVTQWQAARYGISEQLVDVEEQKLVPASVLLEKLLKLVQPFLKAEGDWEEVASQVYQVLQEGNSASRQRKAYQRREKIEDVVDMLIEETAEGTGV